MSGKIILNLAISLDGFIADNNGGFQWIVGQGDKRFGTENQFDFHKDFLNNIDIVVMGKNCYDQGFYKDYANKRVYVATSQKIEDNNNLYFIKGDIVKAIKEENDKGNNIYFVLGSLDEIN